MNEAVYPISGLLIGLLGSLHCLGMCGPITFMLPVEGASKVRFVLGRFLYNFGRIVTYMLFGIVFGLFGSGIQVFGFQQGFSVFLGVVLLISVLLPSRYRIRFTSLPPVAAVVNKVKTGIGAMMKRNTLPSLYLLGILNGFLPCGLVYIAVTAAASAGNAIEGMLLMFFFGVGTLPVMLTASLFTSFVSLKARLRIRKLIPVFVVVMAILFILRGMNLNIPYISPYYNPVVSETPMCHAPE